MGFTAAVIACFSKYATFAGRARRAEFWWFALFNFGVMLILSAIAMGSLRSRGGMMDGGPNPVGTLYWLAVFLPSLAVAVRRLHDTDRSGWWVLLQFLPVIGPLVLIWFFATPGTAGPNRFGPDPLSAPPGGSAAPGGGDGFAPSPLPKVPRR